MNQYNTELNVERVTLEKLKFATQTVLDNRFSFYSDVDTYLDYAMKRMVLRIDMEILGQKLDIFTYPANWKEAVKERWFPKWLKKKYPVKYKGLEISALYPQLKLPTDNYPPVFHVAKMSEWVNRRD